MGRLHSHSLMYWTWNSKLPQLKCGSGDQIKAEFPQAVFDNQSCCFWFLCCSVSLALITQPITASGQSQALYDSSQTTDRGAHLLFAHTMSSKAHHVCSLYRLLLFCTFRCFEDLDEEKWILDLKGRVNAQ